MIGFLFTARNIVIVTLELCLLLMPPMIVVMLPFAVLIAIHRTFDEMHDESELIVMAAVGRSRGQRAAPAIAAAGLLSVICLCLGVFVEPTTNRMADILGHAAQTGGLNKIGDNLLVQIKGLAPDGSLIDVLIVDTRSGEGERIYFAKRGRLPDLDGNPILLLDGEFLVKNRNSKVGSRVQFSAYALSLADVLPRGGEILSRVQSQSTVGLLAKCQTNCADAGGQKVAKELHRRFSGWLYVLSFAAISAWLGSRSRPSRGGAKFGVIGVMLLGLVVRGLGFVALNGAGTSLIEAVLVYLIPASALMLFAVSVYCDGSFRMRTRVVEQSFASLLKTFADFGRIPIFSRRVIEPPNGSGL
jgi:lipopolysaccharide export system permease protein